MSRIVRTVIVVVLVVVGLGVSFSAGCIAGTAPASSAGAGLEVVEEVWDIIFERYVERDKLDAGTLSRGAIEGMVEALDDPYTSYLSAEDYRMSTSGLAGKFEGIGAYVTVKDEQLMVISPIAGSPADEAGVRAGDMILEIDGKSSSGMNLQEAVLQIRGPKGTPVRLLVLHQGEAEPVEVVIIRAEIEVPSVILEMKEDIAYIKITYFTGRTGRELSPVMDSVSREGATGIVLDLRSNPGGLLQAVVDVASYFLEEGVVTYVVNNQGKRTSLSVERGGVTTEVPMVVLTDNFSSSASEVLAGALQDHARATIAGTITYGKGSVNTLYQLEDGSGLYVTTARWLTPDGRLIEGEGITPDYELDLVGDDAIQWAIDYLRRFK